MEVVNPLIQYIWVCKIDAHMLLDSTLCWYTLATQQALLQAMSMQLLEQRLPTSPPALRYKRQRRALGPAPDRTVVCHWSVDVAWINVSHWHVDPSREDGSFPSEN